MTTIEERIRRMRSVRLTGRAAELQDFKAWMSEAIPRYNLLHYFGVGGMGKSSLLTLLEGHCQQEGTRAARLDAAEHRDPLTGAVSLLSQLAASNQGGQLAAIVSRYDEIEERLRRERKVNLATVELMSKLAVLSGSDAPAQVPVDSPATGSGVDSLRDVLSPDDLEFFSDPLPSVSEALVQYLGGDAPSKTCILVDTFEQASNSFETWLSRLLGRFGENSVLVTAGRLQLGEDWQRFDLVTRSVELRELSADEARDLLRLHNVLEPESVEKIVLLAGGLPLALKLFAEHVAQGLTLAESDGGHASIVERVTHSLLAGLEHEVREVVLVCCGLHWFNEELLAELDPALLADGRFDFLRRLPFIRQHGRGLAVHDTVRDFVNDDLRRRAPVRSRQIHHQAHEYFASDRDGLRGVESGALLAEVLYHAVLADERDGIREAARHFNDAADSFQAARCDLIYTAVRDLPVSEAHRLWIGYFAGVTAKLMVDPDEAHRRLREVLASPASRVESELRVYAGRWLAGSLWFAGEFHEVIAVAEETLRLSRQLAERGVDGMKEYEHRALETIGLALDRLGRFAEAIDIMNQLVDSSRNVGDRVGEGWGLLSRGYFNWHHRDWDAANVNLEECLGIARELGSDYMEVYPLGHLGLLHAKLGLTEPKYWASAGQLLDECKQKALPADSKEMDSKASQNLAQLRLSMGMLPEARIHVEEALELARAMSHPYYVADCLRISGSIALEEGDYAKARQAYTQSASAGLAISARYPVARARGGFYELLVLSGEGGTTEAGQAFVEALDSAEGFSAVKASVHCFRALEMAEIEPLEAADHILTAIELALSYNRFCVESTVSFLGPRVVSLLDPAGEARRSIRTRLHTLLSGDDPLSTELRNHYLTEIDRAVIPLLRVSLDDALAVML